MLPNAGELSKQGKKAKKALKTRLRADEQDVYNY